MAAAPSLWRDADRSRAPCCGQERLGLLCLRIGAAIFCSRRVAAAVTGEASSIPARGRASPVQESNGNVMAMPHKLRKGTKPSVADIADSEDLAMGDAQLEMSSPVVQL